MRTASGTLLTSGYAHAALPPAEPEDILHRSTSLTHETRDSSIPPAPPMPVRATQEDTPDHTFRCLGSVQTHYPPASDCVLHAT